MERIWIKNANNTSEEEKNTTMKDKKGHMITNSLPAMSKPQVQNRK
jgi:hypothetical protein